MQANTGEIKKPIRLLIADDHDLVREGYATFLGGLEGFHFTGAAKNGKELLEMIPVLQPDIIITDIQMPLMNGIEATEIITRQYPDIPVIALTVFGEEHQVMKMLQAGARGYLQKSSLKEELLDAIEALKEKENYYLCKETSMAMIRTIAKSNLIMKHPVSVDEFTPRDIAIIRYICEEKSNKEMAVELGVDVRSVETSREKIQKKIGVKNTAGTVIYAIRSGIYKI
ncbi:MAG: response regulator transcription factor [Chitinophagaceae bacterium]|nr:response regulator transcription factor [Chitinophagaceae bacterium]